MTDIGNKAAIGGFSRDFCKRLGKHYGKEEAWTFEPAVAERELRALLAEWKVPGRVNLYLISYRSIVPRQGEWADGALNGTQRVGTGYIHDQNQGRGMLSVKWTRR